MVVVVVGAGGAAAPERGGRWWARRAAAARPGEIGRYIHISVHMYSGHREHTPCQSAFWTAAWSAAAAERGALLGSADPNAGLFTLYTHVSITL